MDDLETVRQRAMDAVAKATVDAAAPPPVEIPDVQATRNTTAAIVRQVEPRTREELFTGRQQRMQQLINATPAATVAAAAMGLGAGLAKGLFSPVSAFLPDAFNDKIDVWEEDSVRKLKGMVARSENKLAYQNAPRTTEFLEGAPGKVGEFVGNIPPLVMGYGAAEGAFNVAASTSRGMKLVRGMGAALTTGGVLSAAAKLDPGESRWSTVATNAAMMGAFELVGVPAMLKAWREEAPSLAKAIPDTLHNEVTAIRAGVPASTEAVDAVIDAAKKDPTIADKPVVLQAVKQKRAKKAVQSPTTTVDPMIDSKTLVAQVVINVDGESAGVINITKDPLNFQHQQTQVDRAVAQIKQLADGGANVSVASVTSGSQEDAKSVLDALQGKKVKPPVKGRKKVPGAAPSASVAENGVTPKAGDVVSVIEEGKPPVKAVVVPKPLPGVSDTRMDELTKKFGGTAPDEQPRLVKKVASVADDVVVAGAKSDQEPSVQPATTRVKLRPEEKADRFARAADDSTVHVEMPDKTIKSVTLSQIQTPLEVGVKQSEVLKPHLDGSDRHGIIHLDSGEVSFEPLGAPQDPQQNYFRSPLFHTSNPDAQWGNDPRLFIHDDGVTIKTNSSSDVDIVTQKRSAKLLVDRGIDPSTHVRNMDMSLRDVAQVELPLANLEELQDAAAARGLTATPYDGHKVTLKSKNGFSRTFANSLEAHEAVLRIPNPLVDNKIEKALEQQWRMGSDNAWDPDVDVNKYLPLHLQEQGIQDLAQGKKPLAVVYTTDAKALNDTTRAIEKQLQVPENTFKIQLLPAMNDGKRLAAVLYNQDAVALQAAKNRSALNFLGVTAREPGDLLRQLSNKKQGIFVLAGRDAESAALYTHYRELGAKELWEKGRIEADSLGTYRRYSKAQKGVVSYPGAGDEFYPGDLSDGFAPPDVSFSSDSVAKPRMAEEMPPYEPDISFGEQPPRWSGKKEGDSKPQLPDTAFRDTSGPIAKIFGQRFRPIMEMSKDMQNRTGVPYYEWYRAIEVGRNKVDQTINPLLSGINDLARNLNREERKQVQLLLELRASGGDAAMEFEKKLDPKVLHASTALQQTYHDFFNGEGITVEDVHDFLKTFPEIRAKDGDFKYAMKGRPAIPKISKLLDSSFTNGTISIDARELDFQRIANRVIRATASERYLMPSWDRVATEMGAFAEAGRIPNDTGSIFTKYLSEVLHMPDALHQSLSRATKQVFGKMGMKLADSEAQDTVSMLTQMNYFANLAWKPGIVLRDMFQTLQTALPIIGARDTMEGWRYGLKWFKDPKIQEDMVKRGIIQPNGIYAPLQEVSQALNTGGVVGKAADVFFNKGTQWNAEAHNFSHVVAYRGQYVRTMRVGQEYLDKKIDWSTFLEKSRLDMRDAPNGPFVKEIQGLMDSGRLERAASRGAEEFAKSTQYLYSRGNAPYVMQSTLGRFLLQYGTWPSWYAENLRNMAVRGSWKNRAGALSRWVGVQSAMFGTANALFGVDLARWTFFSPLGYTGGPAMQMVMQGADTFKSTVDPLSDDPISRIAKARFGRSVMQQFTPLPLNATRDMLKAVKAANRGDWPGAARGFLNLPASKGSLMP